MQSLARKCGNFGTDNAGPGDYAAGARAVGRVADQGMADMRQMHADLVGAAGQEAAFDQRRVCAEPPLDPVTSDRRLATGWRDDRHLLAVGGTAADIADDLADCRRRHAPDDGAV